LCPLVTSDVAPITAEGIDQVPQLAQSAERDARFHLIGQICTNSRVQHPLRDGELHPVCTANDHDLRVGGPPQIPNYRDLAAIQRMMAIADHGSV
jgi:hypothetical protein